MFSRMRIIGLSLCVAAWTCAWAAPAAAQCPAKTTVADTLYNADGSLASGRVTIAWPTFLIGSCQVIAGQATVTVTSGAFSVQLYPNTNASPAGTSYRISFALKSGRITTEYWVVPVSATGVALATVRAPTVPVPAVIFGEAQVTNLVADLAKKVELPSLCPPGKVLESNGSATPPQVNCIDPTAGAGSQHQVNGASLASNSPVNFQNSSSVAFTNPGAGNIQAAIADGAVSAVKLAVSNPSSAQLAGVGDSNIAAAALSPNRISGTAVTQARAVNTNSPITGGGDLSADRTIACPTCVTSISGTANEISATGGSAPVLSLPSIVDFSSKTLKGGTPLTLDGVTADGNKIAVVVTDPTAARNFTLPNADSVAVQPATCSGTDKVSSVSTLGVITCSADQSGGGSNHNLLSATHPDTVAASPVLGDLLYASSSPAWTKLAGNSTTTKKYLAQTGTGSVSAAPAWSQPAFSELSGSATAGQLPNLENHNGTLTPAKGGTGANNTASSGRFLRGDGTNFVTSSVAAAGAGGCTNQFVRTNNDNAAPTCAAVALASDVSGTLPSANGGTGADLSGAASGKYPKANGAGAFAASTLAAAGVGSCTNQVVSALNGDAAPTCHTVAGADFANQSANQMFAGPSSGGAAAPTFRAMVKADTPATTVHTDQANTYTGATTQDMSGITALLHPSAAGAAPTTGGDVRYDSTRQATVGGGNQSTTGFFPRMLFNQNCTTDGNCNTEANNTGTGGVQLTDDTSTTNEEWFNAKYTVPANFLIAKKVLRIRAKLETITGASPPNLTIKLYWGGTAGMLLMATTAVAPSASATRQYEYCFEIQGTAAAGASVSIETSNCSGSAGVIGSYTTGQPVTAATNASKVVIISGQWSANASNTHTVRMRAFSVEEWY